MFVSYLDVCLFSCGGAEIANSALLPYLQAPTTIRRHIPHPLMIFSRCHRLFHSPCEKKDISKQFKKFQHMQAHHIFFLLHLIVCFSTSKHNSWHTCTHPRFMRKQGDWITMTQLAPVALVTARIGQDTCTGHSAERSLNAKTDLPFDSYCPIFARMLFSFHQMPIGKETYHFQACPVTFGPNQGHSIQHSIQGDGKLLNFLLTSGLEHGQWRHAAANK